MGFRGSGFGVQSKLAEGARHQLYLNVMVRACEHRHERHSLCAYMRGLNNHQRYITVPYYRYSKIDHKSPFLRLRPLWLPKSSIHATHDQAELVLVEASVSGARVRVPV